MREQEISQLFSVTIEFKLATLLEWLSKMIFRDYKDSSLDLPRENHICLNKLSMKISTNLARRKFPNLFISSFIGKDSTLRTKLREFAILSKDKDLSFQNSNRLMIKWERQRMPLMVPKMFGWKRKNNSEINLKFSIKLIQTIQTEIKNRQSNLPCTCIKCFQQKKKLFTKP